MSHRLQLLAEILRHHSCACRFFSDSQQADASRLAVRAVPYQLPLSACRRTHPMPGCEAGPLPGLPL